MNKKKSSEAPIGVFDSGLGGLTVVRELRKKLPHERIVYFGDIARLPYGIKSEKQIRDFSQENTEFLLRRNIKALVVACNSSSSAAFSFLKAHYHLPIVDVIRPAALTAAEATQNGKVGVIATSATVHSKAYERAIYGINRRIKVFSNACPLLVPFVEEGILNGQLIKMALERYLRPLMAHRIDTLILGCTHYPMLREAIQKAVGRKVRLIDSAPAAVGVLRSILEDRGEISSSVKQGKLSVFVSDLPNHFTTVGSRFLGEKLKGIKVVRFKYEITKNGKWTL
jgi:glutamate racemase